MKASITTRPATIFGAAVLALLSTGFTTGCATKKHVRQAVGPVEARVGSVEKRTAEQAAALGDVENNVSRVDERAMEADRKAGAAGQAAQAAQQSADKAQTSATAANTLAGQAQHMADQTRSRLTEVVGNLELRSESAVAPGTAVRIDLEDSMLLGEVAGCGSEGPLFVTQIEVVQAIPSLSDLARLVAAVMNEGRVDVSDRNIARAAQAS